MDNNEIKKMIGETFNDLADALETGHFKKVRIGLTTLGSEHGENTLIEAAEIASKEGIEVVLIGPKNNTTFETYETNCQNEAHKIMEELLDKNIIGGCVTLHYNFKIGVSTVGKMVTPAYGKEMLIATTTGASDTDRTIAMFKNTLYGIITAKALGIPKPTVGVLNVDNAQSVVRLLDKLNSQGYDINFTESKRSDGGKIMRGNDLLMSSSDVMVTDTLTGNILMKLFSSFNTGGSYEALGYGYGPGIGFDHKRIINIISRASGTAVIANAIMYAAKLAKGNLIEVIHQEYQKLQACNYEEIIKEFKQNNAPKTLEKTFKMPEKVVVTKEISGIDVLDLDEALNCLLSSGIYSETGMGCTGPVIMVSENTQEKAQTILKEKGYI